MTGVFLLAITPHGLKWRMLIVCLHNEATSDYSGELYCQAVVNGKYEYTSHARVHNAILGIKLPNYRSASNDYHYGNALFANSVSSYLASDNTSDALFADYTKTFAQNYFTRSVYRSWKDKPSSFDPHL